MFKYNKIKYFKIKGKSLFIKYINEKETFLTNNKVDIADFFLKQGNYYTEAKSGAKLTTY